MSNPWLDDESEEVVADDELALPETTDLPRNKALAAQLIAEGELGIKEIAARLGVTRQSLHRWSRESAVKARISEINAIYDAQTYRSGLARKRNRIAARDRVARHLEGLIVTAKRPNVGMVREFNNLLDSISKEMGQWTEKIDITADVQSEHRAAEIKEVRIYLQHEIEPAPQSEYEQSRMIEGEAKPYEPTKEERRQAALAERARYRAEMEARGR